MKTIFVPKEINKDETRVAISPSTVKPLVNLGYKILIEKSAGILSYFDDSQYTNEGAELVDNTTIGYKQADLILKVNPPSKDEIQFINENSSLISFFNNDQDIIDELKKKNIYCFAMESIPRITRAQSHDALSSQSNLAGYKAVLMAANECPKIFPMLMTAAGTIRPARVVILGAGVAGLQAIATAKRLGAVVEVSDIRPAVKEQVLSLGASFIEVPGLENFETTGGYAKEPTKEFLEQQAEEIAKSIARANAVITSALVHGKKAPILIKEEVVKRMNPGSVIVDMAAEQGGNCELTVPGETIDYNGVKIIGALNIAGKLPTNSSELFARNILNVVKDCISLENGLSWKMSDEIVQSALIATPSENLIQQAV